MSLKRIAIIFFILVALGGLASCNTQPDSPTLTSATVQPSATLPPATPTATLPPMAVMVNEDGILLSDFEAELARLQAADAALGKEQNTDEQRQRVLDELVNQALLAQSAYENGFTLDDSVLQTRMDDLAAKIGGAEALQDWQNRNMYDAESFSRALRQAIAADWQRAQIAAALPAEMEQVHARQIFTVDQSIANQLYQQLQAGLDFATISKKYDPLTGGDLGWFPKGTLYQPEVEDAAFALQPGAYSEVIQSKIGYHIVQVIERGERPLSGDDQKRLAQQAVQNWLEQRRAESQVKILLP